MLISAHAQFGRWAGENPNVYTYNCPYASADVTWSSCWDKLKGYVHTSVPAPIGKWGDVHLSAHAKFWSWRRDDVESSDQLERWGQCNFRYSPTAELNPGRHSQ